MLHFLGGEGLEMKGIHKFEGGMEMLKIETEMQGL